MHSYYIYGLNIESEIELNVLLPNRDKPDVFITLGQIENKPPIQESEWSAKSAQGDEVCLHIRDIATFLMKSGDKIIIDIYEDAKLNEVIHFLLGMAMAVILHQREKIILHSSVVEMNGGAVAFLGHSGYGKSSVAIALYENGHKLISDDLAVIDLYATEDIIVYQGFPQTKLWPDFAESIGIDPHGLQHVESDSEKRVRRLYDRFIDAPYVPLSGLYILDYGSEIEIINVTGHQSVIDLVAFSYDINLYNMTNRLGNHLTQCTQLAQKIPIKRLKRPYNLDKMPDVIQAIENDIFADA